MALVYGSFRWSYWLIYVAVTVLFEALVLGRWARIRFLPALAISVGANAATGLLGAGFSGIFGYMAYGVGAKSYVEPNPLCHVIYCLVVGGIASALIEAILWTKAAERSAIKASLLVHLAGIPLALAILLVPNRPYAGLEGQANFRRHYVRKEIAMALTGSIEAGYAKPFRAPKNWDELIQRIEPALSERRRYSSEVVLVAGFQPHFARFDTGEARREPCEFNPSLAGKDLRILLKPHWLVRWRPNRSPEGIVMDRNGSAKYIPNLNGWLEEQKR